MFSDLHKRICVRHLKCVYLISSLTRNRYAYRTIRIRTNHTVSPAAAVSEITTAHAKLLGMKVVFTHHGPDYDRDKWGFAAKAMLRLGEWMGCKFADHVIVISEVIKNLIARQCGRTKNVHLIYNGVPRPQIRDFPEYFEELGIEKGRYILVMCRFVPEKNLHHLVEAFARLKKNDGVKLFWPETLQRASYRERYSGQ